MAPGSYTRSGFAPVLSDARWICRRATVPIGKRESQHDKWSVVSRTGGQGQTLGGGKDVVTTDAVCPACHERQDYEGKPLTLKCTRCGRVSEVDWSETC